MCALVRARGRCAEATSFLVQLQLQYSSHRRLLRVPHAFESNFVPIDERREIILNEAIELARKLNGEMVCEHDMREEVTNLVENLLHFDQYFGRNDSSFFNLPDPPLMSVTVMSQFLSQVLQGMAGGQRNHDSVFIIQGLSITRLFRIL